MPTITSTLKYKTITRNVSCLIVGILTIGSSAFAQDTQHLFPKLTTYDANYYVTFDKFSARTSMDLKFNPENGEYTYGSNTKPRGFAALFGKIREWSIFTIDGNKVVPNSFSHKSRDNQFINYDWINKKAKSQADDKKEILDLQGNELDLLSLQMQLKLDLKNNSLHEIYTVINDNQIKDYEITSLGEEEFTLDDKTYAVIKLKQQRSGSSRHNLIWLAADMDYALVKMEQYKGEERRGTLTMTAYKPTESKPAEIVEPLQKTTGKDRLIKP